MIAIDVQRREILDKRSQHTGSTHVIVRIRDNGGGVAKEHESQVGTSGFTTKGAYGSGHGLAAAREYMQSVGGDLRWVSHFGEGFDVQFHLDEFNPRVHQATK